MKKLKIAFLSYRSKPFSGGQGIYVKYLSKALHDLGHEIDVFSGPPYPDLDPKIKLVKIPSLGLYEKKSKFYDVNPMELLNPINLFEIFYHVIIFQICGVLCILFPLYLDDNQEYQVLQYYI